MDMDFIFYNGGRLYVWSYTYKCVRLWNHGNGGNPTTEAACCASDDDADLSDADALRASRNSGERDSDSPAN
jgi:hypothetical protein